MISNFKRFEILCLNVLSFFNWYTTLKLLNDSERFILKEYLKIVKKESARIRGYFFNFAVLEKCFKKNFSNSKRHFEGLNFSNWLKRI